MKYICAGLCLVTIAGMLQVASEFRHTAASPKASAEVARTRPVGQAETVAIRTSVSRNSESRVRAETADSPLSLENIHSLRPPASADDDTEPCAAGLTAVDDSAELFQSTVLIPPNPVRHRAALHETMITPGNFEYLGAFRPPHVQQNEASFAFGGSCVAYRADGDPSGAEDGYPGSLFLTGHPHHQKVAEISIPVPVNSSLKRADDLSVAAILQPFADITDGILEGMTAGSSEHFQIGGLLVTSGQLHWTMYKYYNVANIDYPSHGTSGLDMQGSKADGPWHLGPMHTNRPEWHSYKHAGYIFEIPTAEASRWFGGLNLISGLQISTGLQASSQGPAMFAYALPPAGTAPNAPLNAVPLVWYGEHQPVERHHPADIWSGGAWLTLGDKQAVVIAGRKALGEFYYGEARAQDCTQDKGYHGPPYEVEMLFYSPASLIHAASGSLPAAGLRPWFRWDSQTDGGGISGYMFRTCSQQLGGMAYDRQRNLLYMVQVSAGKTSDNEYDPLPVIHVFRITEPQ